MGSTSLSRPNITAAQIAGLLVGGVPIVASLLHVFGVYDLTQEQQDALTTALQWGVVAGGTLFGADAAIRTARNHATAKVEAQKAFAEAMPAVVPEAPSGPSGATGAPAAGSSPDEDYYAGDEFELPLNDDPATAASADRILPNVVWRGTVACHSSRNGSKPQLIVIHDTEGANIPGSARDLFGLRDFFDRTATQASAHVGADADGQSIQMVPDALKAWHVAFYNPVTLGIEMVHKHGEKWTDAQYREVARWIAWWARKHDIPIRPGVVAGGAVKKPGVVTHRYLGSLGGGHVDPVDNFDKPKLMKLARHYYALQQKHHKI